MITTIRLPEIGVGPDTRVTLSVWYALPGDLVVRGERVVEVLTEGATFDVAAPATGWLVQHLAQPREILQPGQELGTIDVPDSEKILSGDWS
jgi:pyruvate/2-oxoglutarate dehydrogenase complex dihydrolipoamide acyltransferase (E2) component